jgi:hypothetical protein
MGRTCIFLAVDQGACSDALDCEGVQLAYGGLLAFRSCRVDSDCRLLDGHCELGLGAGCVHPAGVETDHGEFRVTQAMLDELAAQWQALGCTGTQCDDCSAAPTTATCSVGTCSIAG